ncbi:MAG: tetratricopeptide repeat protein [Gemmatimonadetes bacterium]|nr:tetratricopeptide repeat protein [Gemmatimonadota bacterium]
MAPPRNLISTCALTIAFAALVAFTVTDIAASDYFDLGDFHRPVTAASPEAEEWFVRGLVQCYGFNHEEAVRCFERALAIDPDMAMAHWGIAYALGPNYNNPMMEEEASRGAHEAISKAKSGIESASAVERALITALDTRYAWPVPEDRGPLEIAYAAAMRKVYEAFPDDPDVAALFAESLMMLRPWMLWSPDGKPAPETPEIRSVLEPALERWPAHVALCHLYIHTMEPSPDPSLARAAADSLRTRVPDAGHLVHMPSHIDVLLGDYDKVIEANRKAIVADYKFVEREGRLNFFTLYRLHNLHFLVYGAMFDGQRALAMKAANELAAEVPAELLADIPDFVEAFIPTRYHVLVRYGDWKQILAEPEPPAEQPYSRAIHHYARTLALASLNRVSEAEAELATLIEAKALVPESRILFNNTCADILQIAVAMATGEVEYRKGNYEAAWENLRDAVLLDDALNYDEPWGWMQPARHALGALLLEQGHVREAETVYREDLKRHPRNGWSLAGLAESLERQEQTEQAASCKAQLAAAWTRADVPANVSCYCRTGEVAATK